MSYAPQFSEIAYIGTSMTMSGAGAGITQQICLAQVPLYQKTGNVTTITAVEWQSRFGSPPRLRRVTSSRRNLPCGPSPWADALAMSLPMVRPSTSLAHTRDRYHTNCCAAAPQKRHLRMSTSASGAAMLGQLAWADFKTKASASVQEAKRLLPPQLGGGTSTGDVEQGGTAGDIDQESWTESCFPSLSMSERLLGFAICFGLGMLCSFMSTAFILRPTKFAVCYTVYVLSLRACVGCIVKLLTVPLFLMTLFVDPTYYRWGRVYSCAVR